MLSQKSKVKSQKCNSKVTNKTTCYVGVGSNLGDRQDFIKKAIDELGKTRGVRVTKVSSICETEPVGNVKQGKFLNGALELETNLGPEDLLTELHRIEESLGRKRLVRNGPRTIDLDILLYGDEVVNDGDISIPHPRMHERSFVLKPLSEIAPEAVHPALKRSIREIADR